MKLELNVKRFNNEDVIATSSNLTATPCCYKFIDTNSNSILDSGDKYYIYSNGASLLLVAQTMDADFASNCNTYLSNAGTTLDFSKYYRVYEDENGVEYLYVCNDQTHTHQ